MEGRHPLETPFHPFLECFQLSKRSAGNCEHGYVSLVQMHPKAIKVVSPKGTSRAALVPFGIKHEMINNELIPAFKKSGQSFLALGTVKNIILLNLFPGKVASL